MWTETAWRAAATSQDCGSDRSWKDGGRILPKTLGGSRPAPLGAHPQPPERRETLCCFNSPGRGSSLRPGSWCPPPGASAGPFPVTPPRGLRWDPSLSPHPPPPRLSGSDPHSTPTATWARPPGPGSAVCGRAWSCLTVPGRSQGPWCPQTSGSRSGRAGARRPHRGWDRVRGMGLGARSPWPRPAPAARPLGSLWPCQQHRPDGRFLGARTDRREEKVRLAGLPGGSHAG